MKIIKIFAKEDFREWLKKNHKKEEKVSIILQKKHTGNYAPTHNEQINIAICFGWIDTVVKKIDENTYSRNFSKRNRNSSWSINTLNYGKNLLKKNLMSEQGIKFYKLGLKKKPLDYGIPKNPALPEDLQKALSKNKLAKKNFEKFPPSIKKMFYRNILLAKLPVTKLKRIKNIIEKAENNDKSL